MGDSRVEKMRALRLDAEQTHIFDALYRKHHVEVFRLCLKFAAGQRAWALDRAQDVFVKLAESLPTLRDTDELGGWLYRTTVNTCYKVLRREQGWRRLIGRAGELVPVTAQAVEPISQAQRDIATLEAALRRLPPKERALVTLVGIEGKTQSEAAALLGLSKGYVSKLHHRAMAFLKAAEWELVYGD